jgi:iron(III) transport system substrate-binding protein
MATRGKGPRPNRTPAPSPEKPTPSPEKPAPDPREQIIAQAKEEGEVFVIGSHADEFNELLEGFKSKYPFIQIRPVTLNTVKSVNRVMMEAKAGRVTIDMVDVSDDGLYLLAQEGALQKPALDYPHLRDFEPRLQPSSGLFVTYTLNPRPQGSYNTELVSPDEVPTSWEEVPDLKWKGKSIMSASSEEMPGRLAYLWRKDGELDWERSFDFFSKLSQQEPLMSSGYRRGNEQIAAGERSVFWFSPGGPPSKLYYQGAPTGLIAFPTTMGTYRSAGIVNNAPHPAAAWLLIDYLTSPQGQFEFTEFISAVLPLNPKAKSGKLTQFLIKFGGAFENADAAESDYILDDMAATVYTAEFSKKSEDFFLEILGVR